MNEIAQSGATARRDERIVFLDYLRIFAFSSVFIGHKFYQGLADFAADESRHATPRLIAGWLLPIFYGGGAGVVVFFLVSGYIIAHVLQTESPGTFILKRIFRIYPLYIVAVLLENLSRLVMYGRSADVWTIVTQLLLVGDIFGTPYALNGVEWTLRVEVLFYAYMATLRCLKPAWRMLPNLLFVTTIALWLIAPVPSLDIWSKGYTTIYGPFLLLGAVAYLTEKDVVSKGAFICMMMLVFTQYYRLIEIYQSKWLSAHFAIIAFFIFCALWASRNRLKSAFLVLLLSDMTYAVYLFHNWAFEGLRRITTKTGMGAASGDVAALVVFFLVCYLMGKVIEKPGIRLGNKVRHALISART